MNIVTDDDCLNISPVSPLLQTNIIYFDDCFKIMKTFPDEVIDMIYVDPPFGTGNKQKLSSKKKGTIQSVYSYEDSFNSYIDDFMLPYLLECKRLLKSTGTLYLHLDQRYSHYAKVLLDNLLGRDCFINHIVWSYNYGGRGKTQFPKKHDDILVYSKVAGKHKFNWEDVDRIPYKAPGLQKDPVRRARGQVPTDVWEMTIVPTQSKSRTGYPSQKPIKLVQRAITASTDPDDIVLDFCCGSGTTIEAAHKLRRRWIGIDNNQQAIDVMKKRLSSANINATYV